MSLRAVFAKPGSVPVSGASLLEEEIASPLCGLAMTIGKQK
jgi:hypothetical protein